jgi:hypothetical protein
MPWLVISKDGEELDRREITGPAVIGRSLECDICIGDITLSRKHCKIEPRGDEWAVVDVGSRNGTFVNGEQVTDQVLMNGDVIRAADIEVVFRTTKPAGSAARPRDPAEAMRQSSHQPTQARRSGGRERQVILPTPKPRGAPGGGSGSRRDIDLGSTMWRGVRMPIEPPEPPPLKPPPILPAPPPARPWEIPVLVGIAVVLSIAVVVLLVMLLWG